MKITNPFLLRLLYNFRKNYIAIILVIFSISLFGYACLILYNYYSSVDCILDYKNYTISNKQQLDPNEFGDYFGGVLNPLIGITAAFITFLAFYIQFVANNKITHQFKIQQFESQFYEMVKLHKENVNEIEINQIELKKRYNDTGNVVMGYDPDSITIRGRNVFVILANELELAYQNMLKHNKDKKKAFETAYGIFFNGLDSSDFSLSELIRIKSQHKKAFLETRKSAPLYVLDNILIKVKYNLFEGHENILGHYYRHLYHTVKFVTNYDNSILNYSDKRKYLRLLRAQLSNYEQLMLFYNWYSGYGKNWEKNSFFSNYRMIHNLPNNIFFDFDKEYFLKIKESIREKNPNYKMLDAEDFLFESDIKK